MKRIGILAGTQEQFDRYVRLLPDHERALAIRITREEQARAFELSSFKVIGTFTQDPNASKMIDIVRSRVR